MLKIEGRKRWKEENGWWILKEGRTIGKEDKKYFRRK